MGLEIKKKYSSNFSISFLFLSCKKRNAIKTIYKFCRITDDIVDDGISLLEKKKNIEIWEKEFQYSFFSSSKFQLLNKLQSVINEFKIPKDYFLNLIKGAKLDLSKNRYENFDELQIYCDLVASNVGFMLLKIFGDESKIGNEYAKKLGIAFQLTNIIRDIKSDAKRNRIYIPQVDLKKFGYKENDLFQNLYNDSLVSLLKFQVDRTKKIFDDADKLFLMLDCKKLLVAKIMHNIYYTILVKIEKHDFNVFEKKVSISFAQKFKIALKTFVKMKILNAKN